MSQRICSVEDCGRPYRRNGYCDGHEQRLKRYGDVLPSVALGSGRGSARLAPLIRPRTEQQRISASAYHAAHRDEQRSARNASTRRSLARHPDREGARQAVKYAVHTGKLKREACPCGEPKVEAHHHLGYAREHRLDVVWLCNRHHVEAHHSE